MNTKFYRRFLFFVGVSIQSLVLCKTTATTYYVGTNGSDANAGTKEEPWRTVQKAANSMIAGDTAIVSTGTYDEAITTQNPGSLDQPITFRAQDYASINSISINHEHIRIEGFNIVKAVGAWGLISLNSGAHYVEIVDNKFINTPASNYGIWWNSSSADMPSNALISGNEFIDMDFICINPHGSGHTITNNVFSSNKGWDAIRLTASNSVISDNEFYWRNEVNNPNHTDCIQSFTTGGWIALNNVIERNIFVGDSNTQIGNIEDQDLKGNMGHWTWRNNIFVGFWSINIYGHHFEWYNNIFYKCPVSHPLQFRSSTNKGNATNGKVYNNIFIECGANPASKDQGWYGYDSPTVKPEADYNLIIGPNGSAKNINESNGINGGYLPAQIFKNITALDFAPTATSPVIDNGVDLSLLFSDDLNQRDRSNKWDIGAIEHSNATAAPIAPSELEAQ